MARTLTFKAETYWQHQIDKSTKTTHSIRLCAKEIIGLIKEWNLPLTPNVREPQKNAVVESLLGSFSSSAFYEIPSPIHIAAKSCKAQITFNGSKCTITLVLLDGDGVIDGGHRLLSLIIADFQGIDLSHIRLKLEVHVGLSAEEVKEKAIALNTSKQVTTVSLNNYKGLYEPLKPLLKEYQIQYYENQESVPDDPYCRVNRVVELLLLLDLDSYNPYGLNPNKKHPSHLLAGSSTRPYFVKIAIEKYSHLIEDAIKLQSAIALQVAGVAHDKTIPFVTKPKDPKNNTRLPTGEVLSFKLPSKVYVYPTLSAFRLNLDKETLCWKKDIRIVNRQVVKDLVKRYLEILGLKRFQDRSAGSVIGDRFVWDSLCETMETLLKKVVC